MPKLDSFTLEIKTGERRGPEKPIFNINGFPLEFEEMTGGTGAGETLKATGSVFSFPHALALIGPSEGSAPWDIESVRATYQCANVEPYTVHMGAATLDDESNLNIWHEPPPPTFDV
jgi:hypothetical protein